MAAIALGVVALVALGAGAAAVAFVFGLVPGFRVVSPIQPLADSAAPDTTPQSAAAPAPADTAALVLPTGLDTLLAVGAPVSPADSADGQVVYQGDGRCVGCHGAAGEGVAGLGPNLRDERWLVGDGSVAAIARVVREGVAPPREFPIAMPGYGGQLAEADIARVAAYVYALSHPTTPTPPDSLPPDSARVPPR